MNLLTSQWNVHGITLRFETDHPVIEQLFSEMLRGFGSQNAPEVHAAIRIQFLSSDGWPIPATAEVLPPSSNEIVDTLAAYDLKTTFAREGSLNYYEIAPMGGALYDISHGSACGYIRSVIDHSAWRVTHLLLLIILLEMLRGQQLFWVHAGAVAHKGRGVLIVGQTGSGKTTTVLNLAHSGFGFLSEDRTLVRHASDGLKLLAFPLDLSVTPDTLTLLPWLNEFTGNHTIGRGKVHLNPLDVFGSVMADRADPALILFPAISRQANSRLVPVDPAHSLRRILPNSLLASNPVVSRQHFTMIGDLVSASQSYRLELGMDFARLPDLIRELLG